MTGYTPLCSVDTASGMRTCLRYADRTELTHHSNKNNKRGHTRQPLLLFGRNDRVRTCDIVLPKHARYQLRYIPKVIKLYVWVGMTGFDFSPAGSVTSGSNSPPDCYSTPSVSLRYLRHRATNCATSRNVNGKLKIEN